MVSVVLWLGDHFDSIDLAIVMYVQSQKLNDHSDSVDPAVVAPLSCAISEA